MRRNGFQCFHCLLFWIKAKEVMETTKKQHQFAPLYASNARLGIFDKLTSVSA